MMTPPNLNNTARPCEQSKAGTRFCRGKGPIEQLTGQVCDKDCHAAAILPVSCCHVYRARGQQTLRAEVKRPMTREYGRNIFHLCPGILSFGMCYLFSRA